MVRKAREKMAFGYGSVDSTEPTRAVHAGAEWVTVATAKQARATRSSAPPKATQLAEATVARAVTGVCGIGSPSSVVHASPTLEASSSPPSVSSGVGSTRGETERRCRVMMERNESSEVVSVSVVTSSRRDRKSWAAARAASCSRVALRAASASACACESARARASKVQQITTTAGRRKTCLRADPPTDHRSQQPPSAALYGTVLYSRFPVR